MKALDTNLLVRHLTQDHAQQARMVSAYLEHHCTPETPGYINHIVLCELVWVLESCYGYLPALIASAVQKILQTQQLMVEKSDLVWEAVELYRTGTADFADALIGLSNQQAGCTATATLDRKAARLDCFELID